MDGGAAFMGGGAEGSHVECLSKVIRVTTQAENEVSSDFGVTLESESLGSNLISTTYRMSHLEQVT